MVWVSTTGDRQAVRGGIREILHSQGWNHLWPHCFLNPNCKLFHGNVWKSLIWRHWKFPNEFIAVNLITMPFFFLFHGHTLWFVELVTWPGIEPRTQEWNPQILTTGQPGNSHHAILREKKKKVRVSWYLLFSLGIIITLIWVHIILFQKYVNLLSW